jgi:Zn-dependent peptidase ImmA (M78 family)
MTIAQGEPEHWWKLYGFSEPKDLILEDLALVRGVLVTEGPMEKMEARLIRSGDKGLIRVRQDIPELGRKRFAIAHELGHWELHKDISQLFACTSDDMIASYKSSEPEDEANIFASGLLMPSSIFQKQIESTVLSLHKVREIADYFLTSLTATSRRYVSLSQDYCAMVISEDRKIKWWHASKSFKQLFYLSAGTELSPNTVAGSFFFKGEKPKKPEEIDIEAWTNSKPNSELSTFIEESIYMKHYNKMLTLIRLP